MQTQPQEIVFDEYILFIFKRLAHKKLFRWISLCFLLIYTPTQGQTKVEYMGNQNVLFLSKILQIPT